MAPRVVEILFKLEGGDGAQEIRMEVPEAEKWVNYQIDFSESVGKGHTRLVLFVNPVPEPMAGEVYYFDDISWGLPPSEACIVDFEGEAGSAFIRKVGRILPTGHLLIALCKWLQIQHLVV